MSAHLSGVEAMTLAARLAAIALVYEVEQTCKWLDGLAAIPRDDAAPTTEQLAELGRVIEHRRMSVERELRAVSATVQAAMSATELLAEQRRTGSMP